MKQVQKMIDGDFDNFMQEAPERRPMREATKKDEGKRAICCGSLIVTTHDYTHCRCGSNLVSAIIEI